MSTHIIPIAAGQRHPFFDSFDQALSKVSAKNALSVSNSSSGRRGKLDHAPAVGDPTHMVEFGTGRRAFAREA